MRKITKFICIVLTLMSAHNLKSQCTTPAPPAITGQTYAPCVSSNVFTVTANPTGTLSSAWYAFPYGGNSINTNSVQISPSVTSSVTYYANQFSPQGTSSIALPAYVSGYNGNTRGMWFQAPADFVITGVRVPLDVGGTANSAIAIMKFPTTPPAFSSVTNSFNILFMNQNITTTNVVSVYIPVYAGDIIGLLGARGGVTSYGPTGAQSSTIGSNTLTLTRLGMQYPLATQTPTDIWQEVAGSLGRMEVYTTMGCLSPMVPVTLTVAPSPSIIISGPPAKVCANSTTTLSASGVNTYTWFSGSNSTSITVTPSVNTTYTISGSISPTCVTSAAITISVDPGVPSLTVSPSTSVCSGNTVMLTGSGATTYSWTGGIQNGVAFTPTATANYVLTGGNSCGTVIAQRTVTVNITPTLVVPATYSVCDGSSVTLSVSGAGTYTWLSTNQTGSQISVSPTITSLYQVLGMSAQGCTASASPVVIVNPVPVINAFGSSATICYGKSATLTVTGNAHTFSWSAGGTTSVTVSPTVTTSYYATGTFTDTQCSRTSTVTVNVFKPIPSISSNTTVCLGSAVTLTAGGATNFTWQPGGSQFSQYSPSPTVSTTYTASGISTSLNVSCPGSNTVLVTVNALPVVTASSTRTSICKGEKTTITAGGASTYTWTGVSSNNATVQVSPAAQTLYSVDGTDQNGCSSTGTILVKVNSCVGIEQYDNLSESVSIFPNPSNGTFTVRSSATVNYALYNALGQAVRSGEIRQDSAIRIDGLSSGVYYFAVISGNEKYLKKLVVE